MNQTKLVFSMIWFMDVFNIQQKEQASDKVIKEIKHLTLLKIQNMMDIKDKTSAKCGDVTTLANKSKNQIRQNQQLPEELHKPIIRKILKKNSLFHI